MRLALLALAACSHATSLRYDIIRGPRVAGHATLAVHRDTIDEDFAYNDRGRGPQTHAHVELAGGMPVRFDLAGKDYLKRDVHEHLECAARCRWDSTDEHGAGPRAFFVPIQDTVSYQAALLQFALRPDGVPLLGGGTAHARRALDTTLSHPGGSIHVTAYEIDGFAFTPFVQWFDDDGNFFAAIDEWGGTIREGWRDQHDRLLALEKPLGQARRERIAKQVAHRVDALAIIHARVFDPETKTMRDDQTIAIENGKIVAAPPPRAVVIDAHGKTVLPGLWDMHGHVSDDDGVLELAEGITTVRDLGNEMTGSLARRARWDAGTELGPHLVLAGLVDGRGEFQAPTGLFVDSEAEAKQTIEKLVANGYVQLKIYSSIKPELVPVLVREAHAHGLRVSGHVPAHMIAEDAVADGFDELQHVNFLMLDLLSPRTDDTRTPLRFTLVAQKAAGLDLDSPPVQKLVDTLVTHHTVIDPTLAAFESMFTTRPGKPSPLVAAVYDRLPPQLRRGALAGGLPVPPGMDQTYRDSFTRCMQLVKRLWDRGVTIVAGTDDVAGFTLHRELELYVQAGIPAADVLALATLGAARVMHRDATSGSLAPGKDADLIIIDGDPLANISAVRNVVTTIKGSTVVDDAAAQRALAISPGPASSPSLPGR